MCESTAERGSSKKTVYRSNPGSAASTPPRERIERPESPWRASKQHEQERHELDLGQRQCCVRRVKGTLMSFTFLPS